jgi:hypothetical protein
MSDEILVTPHFDKLPILRSEEEMEAIQRRMSTLVGEVVRESAGLEFHLRQLMVCLLDSKYAAVVAAGLGANELIDMCTALVKINREVTDTQRAECRAKLATLKPLLVRRNQLVHGLWLPEHVLEGEPLPDRASALVSKRRTAPAHVDISFEEVEELAYELSRAGSEIFGWICGSLRAQLRAEQVTEPPVERGRG